MNAMRSQEKVLVRRITVDEPLADDLIRLMICPLAGGVEEFFDREGDWGEEHEVWVRPETYTQKLGIPSSEMENWPWEALTEGQVFLSGEFEIVGDRWPDRYFKVSRRRKEFLRIDDLEVFIEGVKREYSGSLSRR